MKVPVRSLPMAFSYFEGNLTSDISHEVLPGLCCSRTQSSNFPTTSLVRMKTLSHYAVQGKWTYNCAVFEVKKEIPA
jgi:hypothetical protein